MKISKDQIADGDEQEIELPGGLTAKVQIDRDDDADAPWEGEDGHGPISDWTSRDIRAGERVLHSDGESKRYYTFGEAMEIAKRDGWGLGSEAIAELTAKLGRAPTKGEICAQAVENDFKRLADWCADVWYYVGVIVTLSDSEGKEIACDSVWGIESDGDYWKETAVEMINSLLAAQETEQTERAEWEARDTVTKP